MLVRAYVDGTAGLAEAQAALPGGLLATRLGNGRLETYFEDLPSAYAADSLGLDILTSIAKVTGSIGPGTDPQTMVYVNVAFGVLPVAKAKLYLSSTSTKPATPTVDISAGISGQSLSWEHGGLTAGSFLHAWVDLLDAKSALIRTVALGFYIVKDLDGPLVSSATLAAVDLDGADVTWTATDNSGKVTSTHVLLTRDSGPKLSADVFTEGVALAGNATSYSARGLQGGAGEWYAWVVAKDFGGLYSQATRTTPASVFLLGAPNPEMSIYLPEGSVLRSTNAAENKNYMRGTAAMWVRLKSQPPVDLYKWLFTTGTGFRFQIERNIGELRCTGPMNATLGSLLDGEWHHALATWDFNGAGDVRVYFDGALVASQAVSRSSYMLALDNFSVGGRWELSNSEYDVDVAEVYFGDLPVADASVFIENGGRKDLGTDGSLPTGSIPDIYINGNSANLAAPAIYNYGAKAHFEAVGPYAANTPPTVVSASLAAGADPESQILITLTISDTA